jgi:hypothetical protein
MAFITNITTTPVTGVLVDGVPSGMDNDHGNIRDGGTIAETTKFSSNALGEGGLFVTLVSGQSNVIAVAGGTWNFGIWPNLGSGAIVRVTDSLGGVSNNALLGGGSDSSNGDSIHQATRAKVRLYKTAVRAGDWNEYTGAWASTPSVVYSGGWNNAANVENGATLKASGTDHAANPSSAKPGALQYDLGQIPVQTGYQPRYLW